MAFDRPVLHHTEGLLFWRLLGTGRGTSMSLGADLSRWAMLAVWRDEPSLEEFMDRSPIAARWRGESLEAWHVRLRPLTSRGSWGGTEPFGPIDQTQSRGPVEVPLSGSDSHEPMTAPPSRADTHEPMTTPPSRADSRGPVAVVTRASIRVGRLAAFYRSVAAVDRDLREQDGCLASVGVGEWPLARQATFSLWRDAAAVRSFAYRGAAHRQVIGRVRDEGWYSEELFARFAPYGSEGTWDGADPLG
ncbi:spheroidene monooxygenase [Sphaerisporangium sp. NPDC049002]|uniref:spheroidene monooxygenase n=1 Tax=Sphaerisporangium sp. NPDC049002 TaxID=3155392 RepID=UPI0033C3AB8D